MTRDELEAAIWRHWPTRGTEAAAAVDAILTAADDYATTTGGITAQRRRELQAAVYSRPRTPGRRARLAGAA
jgi:hypothetical protein